MSLSREFAAFVAKLTYEDLPPEVVDRAKGVTLQALSSALVAHDMPASRQPFGRCTEHRGLAIALQCSRGHPDGERYAGRQHGELRAGIDERIDPVPIELDRKKQVVD